MTKKTATNIIMILLALLLVGGMAIQFMPSGGETVTSLFKGEQGTPALRVNGQAVTAEHLAQIEQNNPSPFKAQGGALEDDFRTFLISRVVQQEVLKQASSDIDVPKADVDAEVQSVREQRGLTKDAEWTDTLQRLGLSDSEYRKQVRESLAIDRKIEEIGAAAGAATPEEVKTYYDLNPTLFRTEQRLKGRQIVVPDKAKAEALLAEAKGGADFAELARKNSAVGADTGGALGAVGENGELQPVEPVALPTEVSEAALDLGGPGIAGPIESGGQFYLVKVEELIAPQKQTLEEVRADIQKTLDERKKAAAVEKWVTDLLAKAQVETVDNAWEYHNPVVAEVAGQQIPYSELVGRVLQNQQLMMMMQSMEPDKLEELINGMLKPSAVEQLIQSYAAGPIVEKEKVPLVGTRDDLLAGLVAYGGRDASVSEAELQAAYDERQAQFETPASAVISEATFPDREQALAFRQDWTGGNFTDAATKAGAIVSERGDVGPADGVLDASLAQAIFEGNLRSVGEGSLSDIVETPSGWQVAYVQDLRPATVKPLDEVRDVLRDALLNEKQGAMGEEYVNKQVEALKPVNHLDEVLAAQKARLGTSEAASTPAEDGAASDPAEDAAGEGDAASTPAEDAASVPAEEATPATGAPAEGTPADAAPATGEDAAPAEGAAPTEEVTSTPQP